MPTRSQIESRRTSLDDIRGIMHAMRTLAHVEAHKLAGLIDAQHSVVSGIESAAADFVSFHPELAADGEGRRELWLLVGSERGFCGDFNRALARFAIELRTERSAEPLVVSIGQRLSNILRDQDIEHQPLAGASVVEEVESVLLSLTEALEQILASGSPFGLSAIHHDGESDRPVVADLLPAFGRRQQGPPMFSHMPLLNLSPAEFFRDLTEHFLYATLHNVLYTSLMAESMVRIHHIDAAIDHIDRQMVELQRSASFLRQEEITEEIQIILLSAQALHLERSED